MKRIIALLMALLLTIPNGIGPVRVYGQEKSSYLYGKIKEGTLMQEGAKLKDSFYYSDDWFSEAPDQQNDALALISMQLCATVCENEDSDAKVALKEMGVDDITFYGFEGSDTSDPDGCALAMARKTTNAGPLTVVVVQSIAYDKETKKKGWGQNFMVNDPASDSPSGEHYAFSRATDKVMDKIRDYAGDSKCWIMGQSRGGALANIIASRLPKEKTYAYTFEAPATTDSPTATDDYPNIHNYLCGDDPVPKLPPWGMTRYGKLAEIDIKSNIKEELVKLESKAADSYDINNESYEEKEKIINGIMDSLLAVVPERAAYSKAQPVPGTQESYSYQEAMVRLIESVFAGDFEGINAEALLPELDSPDTQEALHALYDAKKLAKTGSIEDMDASNEKYMAAAKGINQLLGKVIGGTSPLMDKDLYMVLKLFSEYFVDENADLTGKEGMELAMAVLDPLLNTVVLKDVLVYSHHFDTLIARLKNMAPQAQAPAIDLTLDAPKAGDDMTEFLNEIGNLISPDLSAKIAWLGNDTRFADNKIYSLSMTLHYPGRIVDKDSYGIKINGQEAQALDISYEDGEYVVRAFLDFTIGDPSELTISFDNMGRGQKIEDVKVKAGSRVGPAVASINLPIVHEGLKSWKFAGWTLNGENVQNVVADEDLTLTASWQQVIDRIDLTFVIPEEGGRFVEPKAPEGAGYELDYYSVYDSSGEEAETAKAGKYHIFFIVSAQGVPFLTGMNDSSQDGYIGEIAVNKKPADYSDYYGDSSIKDKWFVEGEFYFTIKKKVEPAKQTTAKKTTRTTAKARTGFKPLMLRSDKQTKKQAKLSWKKLKNASSYVVYGSLAGKKMKKIAATRKNTYTVKKLKKGKAYQFCLVALGKDKKPVAKSLAIRLVTKGGKYKNYKSVRISVGKKIKKKAVLRKGKKLKIKGIGQKPSKKARIRFTKIAYLSSNPKIATVSKTGVVRGLKKGKCTITAYGQNGLMQTLTLTVK